MNTPIKWDKSETFTASNGETCTRYAISSKDGVTLEFSIHDPTIQSIVPREYWLAVWTATVTNARFERIDDQLCVLVGFGKSNDPLCNLALYRISTRRDFSRKWLGKIMNFILMTLVGFGIHLDKQMKDLLRNN